MKTIKQQAEVAFNAIEIQDAIIVAPLMDVLINAINGNDLVSSIDGINQTAVDPNHCKKVYSILTKIGFCGTGIIDLLPQAEEDEPVELGKPYE